MPGDKGATLTQTTGIGGRFADGRASHGVGRLGDAAEETIPIANAWAMASSGQRAKTSLRSRGCCASFCALLRFFVAASKAMSVLPGRKNSLLPRFLCAVEISGRCLKLAAVYTADRITDSLHRAPIAYGVFPSSRSQLFGGDPAICGCRKQTLNWIEPYSR